MRAPQRLPEELETTDGRGHFRPHGECTLLDAVDRIAVVIAYCREHNIGTLLVNTTALTGVHIPTLVERFLIAEEWASLAHGMVIVAMVTPPAYIHPRKFGAKVAADLGLTLDVFTSEADALTWLAIVAPRS